MRVLLDQNVPKNIIVALTGHVFRTSYEMGWASLSNGQLLRRAEDASFDVMLTADRRIRYQQNLARRQIALVVVSSNNRSVLLQHVDRIQVALDRSVPGGFTDVDLPRPLLVRRHWRDPNDP